MCREHVLQLQQINWSGNPVEIVVISFEEPEVVGRYRDEAEIRFRVISDPTRQLYHLFEMHRAAASQIINWRSLRGYLGLVFGKRRAVKWPSNHDYLQLGGDVVIDPLGQIQLHHTSESPDDRPDIEQVRKLWSPAPG
jgi:hypothetical protein